ncbi:LPXTG cell wall anchor domain-containing protein [Streptomyces synnematoformans]|uniref:LPXTG cell wall anchor domain-containing protein n=1 Tax=Streptomyces synnematoformans TaxID=415721 RepID=A0ABP5KDS4_9ACTN
MRTIASVGAVAAAAAASLLLSAPSALATDTYTVELRQELPRTTATTSGGVPQEKECPGVPRDQDGWHFVLPGNSSEFVKLTVTFEPGGEQVITEFGPPSGKHANVASAPGAQLTSAVAEVEGGKLELFNLSHTCPTMENPTESPSPSTSMPATDTPTDQASEPAGEPSEGGASGGSDADATPSASSAPGAQGGGDDSDGLAATGASVTGVSVVAAGLLGLGGYLVLRRRGLGRQS